jgi:UDPglucose 6-dehydrogenase
MREAPSTVLAARLLAEGARVRSWDPIARPASAEPWLSATRCQTPAEAMEGADAAVIVTEWPQLLDVDWAAAARTMRRRVLYDGRNVLDPALMREHGFDYTSVGRP